MSRVFFYTILIITNIVSFVVLMNKFIPKNGNGGYMECFLIMLVLFIASLIFITVYEILRAKRVINKTLNSSNKKNRNLILFILSILIIGEIIIFYIN